VVGSLSIRLPSQAVIGRADTNLYRLAREWLGAVVGTCKNIRSVMPRIFNFDTGYYKRLIERVLIMSKQQKVKRGMFIYIRVTAQELGLSEVRD